jgi:hypothetical protein
MADNMSGSVDWKWVFISMGIFLVAQVTLGVVFTIFGLLTLGIGFIAFLIFKPIVYFVGGYITGVMSPGITVKEPAIGALLIVVLSGIFDFHRIHHGLLWIIISAAVAYFCALWGAQMGEGK